MSNEKAIAFFEKGNAHLEAGELDQAIKNYNKAIALNPKDTAVFYARGLAYTEKGEFDQAIKNYSQVIVLNPNDTAAFYARGSTYYDKGEFDQAIKNYSQVIVLNPNDTAAFYARGLAYAEKGEFYQAIKDYSQVIVLNPNDTAAFYARGLAYRKLGKEQEAIKDFQKANQLDPTVIPEEQGKKTEERVTEVEETVKQTDKKVTEVQDFQEILEDLKTEYQGGEQGWFRVSIAIVTGVFGGLLYLILCREEDFQIFYPLYIFLSVITFIVIRQYTNAKQLRIEASNRLAMAKMFEKIQQTKDNQPYKDFIPKIIDSIAYSMRKNQQESTTPIDELLKHFKK